MINPIKQNIFQLHFKEFGSCVYILQNNKKIILIDTSSKEAREELLENLKSLNITPEKINAIILTHNHYDHVQNLELFKKAKIYRAESLSEDSTITEIPEMKIIETPGHTPESKSYLYKEILFSGDTLFHNGFIGRTDLSGGSEERIKESLEKLKKINFKILCPGHLI